MIYPKFRIGFMPTRRRFFSKEDSLKYKELIAAKIRVLAPECDIFDLEGINEEGLLRGIDDAEKAVEHFKKNEVDCLFIPHCNFGTEDAIAFAAKKIGKPVLLWGPRDESPLPNGERLRDSQCGLFATSKVFQRSGIPFSYIVSSRIDTPVFENGFRNFLRAADSVRHFKNARIGQVSTRPRDFYSVIVNEGELLERFGTQVVPREVGSIAQDTREFIAKPNDAIRARAEELKKRADFKTVSADLPMRLAAFEYSIKQWAEKERLDAIAVQCWDQMQKELGFCPCFIHGELTTMGLPMACETDIHGALSSLLLQGCLHFKDPTFFADVTVRHPENDNAELLWHCGPFPAALAEGKYEVSKHFVLPGNPEGVVNCALKSGDLTIARFDGVKGKYSLFCGEGKAVPGPYNKGTYVYIEVPDWPLWEEKLIYGPYIHHVAGAYGKWSSALYEAVRFIDNLEFDPAQPGVDEIRKNLREGR